MNTGVMVAIIASSNAATSCRGGCASMTGLEALVFAAIMALVVWLLVRFL